jgi:hypothetical protein
VVVLAVQDGVVIRHAQAVAVVAVAVEPHFQERCL